jgi:alpha-mannosidase
VTETLAMTTAEPTTAQPAAGEQPAGNRGEPRDLEVLHMVGNAHLDHVWLWRWQEGYQEARATFASAADRLDEYPEFRFTADSVAYFAMVAESDPALFARIRSRVAEGRCEPVGGWWVEPDCNLPCGESLVRQGLYGQRWLHEQFGRIATTGSNVDSFGHAGAIPQILRGQRMDGYVFLRPGPHEKALPDEVFRWRAADGSEVLGYRIPHEYRSPGDTTVRHVDQVLAKLPGGHRELMCFYGVGNHGGGPTRANLDSIRQLGAADTVELRHSTPPDFFAAVRRSGRELPVVDTELQIHAVGCYSAHSGIKQLHRRAENALLAAEKWCVLAHHRTGTPYPHPELADAWRLLLLNQFHDILGGTSIRSACEDAVHELGAVLATAERLGNRARQQLSRRIAIAHEPQHQPVVVFNPHPWPVDTTVEVELETRTGASVVDEDGAAVPVQQVRSAALFTVRRRFAFPAQLPPLGYRTFRAAAAPVTVAPQERPDTVLENEHLRVELDPERGGLSTLLLTGSGAQLMAGTGDHAVVCADPSDTWSHGVVGYDRPAGAFRPDSVRVVEDGPVRRTVRVRSRYGGSTLLEDYVLDRGARQVRVDVTLDWRERLTVLKLRFPTALQDVRATFETPYGHAERPSAGAEVPMQNFADVSGVLPSGPAGLTVVNDGKYGADAQGADLGVTVVRSPVYAWHDPTPLEDDFDHDHQDQGVQRFTCWLVPHDAAVHLPGAVRRGLELNQPPVVQLETFHDGPLPQRAGHVDDGGGSVVLGVCKRAEDGDGTVLRARETAGRGGPVELYLPVLSRRITAEFGPYELRTFLVPDDAAAPVRDVDLLEWPEEGTG